MPHSMDPDLQDQASLQNGMKLYVNYCMGCHSLEHQRFSRAAEDLGIPQDLVEENLIFRQIWPITTRCIMPWIAAMQKAGLARHHQT